MNSHQDNLWHLVDEWIHDAEVKCQEYDVQLSFIKEKIFDDILQFITLETLSVDSSSKTLPI